MQSLLKFGFAVEVAGIIAGAIRIIYRESSRHLPPEKSSEKSSEKVPIKSSTKLSKQNTIPTFPQQIKLVGRKDKLKARKTEIFFDFAKEDFYSVNEEWLSWLKINRGNIRKKYSKLIGALGRWKNFPDGHLYRIDYITFGIWIKIYLFAGEEKLVITRANEMERRNNEEKYSGWVRVEELEVQRAANRISSGYLATLIDYHITRELLKIIIDYSLNYWIKSEWTPLEKWIGHSDQSNDYYQEILLKPTTDR